jgi:hypothetical protein
MAHIPEDLVLVLTAVVGRLKQVSALWHEALAAYFDPSRFTIALQNCITTSRTVTFILQSHKTAVPGFDDWYGAYQRKFAGDPVMIWARDARNKIEKQGDLKTLSQIRAELIAAYSGNPVTGWASVNVGWSPEQIRRSIPARLIDLHVIESGVLSIERRWIDVELPGQEILDALAHVYGQLALMIVSLHDLVGVEIPQPAPGLGPPLLRNLLPDGRQPSMERPLEDRAIYIAVKDGSLVGYRRQFGRIDATLDKKARRRYRKNEGFARLNPDSTLLEIARIHFQSARTIMIRDGFHAMMFIPLQGAMPVDLIVAPPRDRADKYMLVRDIARYVRRIGADGLLRIAETWIASREDIPRGGFAADAPNRTEALTLAAVNARGEQIQGAEVRLTRGTFIRLDRICYRLGYLLRR